MRLMDAFNIVNSVLTHRPNMYLIKFKHVLFLGSYILPNHASPHASPDVSFKILGYVCVAHLLVFSNDFLQIFCI